MYIHPHFDFVFMVFRFQWETRHVIYKRQGKRRKKKNYVQCSMTCLKCLVIIYDHVSNFLEVQLNRTGH